MVKHILLPTDGSRLSGKGAAEGVRLAKALGAKVTGVYVAAPYYRPPGYLEGGVYIPGVSPKAYRKHSEAQAKSCRRGLDAVLLGRETRRVLLGSKVPVVVFR